MAETTLQLGFVPKNRGEYQSTPVTRYYKDNVVQYNGSSYIADPIGWSEDHPTDTYVTIAPTDASGNLNAGWRVFASGNNTFTTGEKVNTVGIDSEPTAGSNNLVKSGGVLNRINIATEKLEYETEEYTYHVPVAQNMAYLGTIEFFSKIGDRIEIIVSRNYTSINGGRIYANAAPNLITDISVSKIITIGLNTNKVAVYDAASDNAGTLTIKLKRFSKYLKDVSLEDITESADLKNQITLGLKGEDNHLLTNLPILSASQNKAGLLSSEDKINLDLCIKKPLQIIYTIPVYPSSMVFLGSINLFIKKDESFTITISTKNYTSINDGRWYYNNDVSVTGGVLSEGIHTIKANQDINSILFYDSSIDNEGTLTITINKIEEENNYITEEELPSSVNEIIQNNIEENKEQEFSIVADSEHFKLVGTLSCNIKTGQKFTLTISRTYTSDRSRIYQNAAPDSLGYLEDGTKEYTAKKNITALCFYEQATSSGTLTVTLQIKEILISRTEFDNLSNSLPKFPYVGQYGTVIGDSHAVRRASWVPLVYNRLGITYDPNVASFVVGLGNEPGAGYEDCIDCVFAQAKRAVEAYNNGNQINWILLDNVHYVYTNTNMGAIVPFKMNQLVNLGNHEAPISDESVWFTDNFSTIIASIPLQKLGTTLKSTWSRKVYTLTFSGTPVAGTVFSLIVDGVTYNTPVENGDTLSTFAARVATWVIDEQNWTLSSNNNVVTISYVGSSSGSLTISYNPNNSGITISVSEGSNISTAYRYYNSKSLTDWNSPSSWVRMSNWTPQGLKGAIEYLMENIPEVRIIMISLPYIPVSENTFETELGLDQEQFVTCPEYQGSESRKALIQNLASYYNLTFVDFLIDGNLSVQNYFEYFPEHDAHPYASGYAKLADCICCKLGF